MKEKITNDEMWDYIHRYYGYGCVDAPVYLIGKEEGGGNIDYRYDRFINAVSDKTCIDIDNPIDKKYKIRTLDGSAFHKQIWALQNNCKIDALTRWLYSGDVQTEDEQSTFTPIVDNIISPLYERLYNTKFERKEFQAKHMARINSKYPLFVSELYPLACARVSDIPAWSDIIKFTNYTLSSPITNRLYNNCDDTIAGRRVIHGKYTYYDDIVGKNDTINSKYPLYYNRCEVLKKLVENNNPKVVIMYGGIGPTCTHFYPYWNKIANNPIWEEKQIVYTQQNGNETRLPVYLYSNSSTLFIKMLHPVDQRRHPSSEYFKQIYQKFITKYL